MKKLVCKSLSWLLVAMLMFGVAMTGALAESRRAVIGPFKLITSDDHQAQEKPKVEKPKAEEPKAEEPVTEEPKAEEPVTEEPKTEEPKAEEPKTEEPVTEEPKTEEPKAEEPKTEEPVTEEPKAEEPNTEEPKAEEPKTEEPKAEEPKTEEPVTEEPKAEEPNTEEPANEEPVTEEPVTEDVTYVLNADGVQILDQEGNPIPEANRALYQADENGTLILDENGRAVLTKDAETVIETTGDVVAKQSDIDIRLAPDGMSEILVTVSGDTALEVLGREGDWLNVKTGETVGYIYRPEVEATETGAPVEMKVTIFSSRRSVMAPGETVTLTSELQGFDGYEVLYQWQCDAGNGFENVEGATENAYSFEATFETLNYGWRLAVYYR